MNAFAENEFIKDHIFIARLQPAKKDSPKCEYTEITIRVPNDILDKIDHRVKNGDAKDCTDFIHRSIAFTANYGFYGYVPLEAKP